MSEFLQCPHEVIEATCGDCDCPCAGCQRIHNQWTTATDAPAASEGDA